MDKMLMMKGKEELRNGGGTLLTELAIICIDGSQRQQP